MNLGIRRIGDPLEDMKGLPGLHHFLIEHVSKICCQSTAGNSFGRITKMKNDVGMGLLV